MKMMGRRHRPFFRICAMDSRRPRDGTVIEELGHYDPLVKETDARAVLKNERIDYWLSVGAKPSDKVRVLIQKYGTNGTHLEQQKAVMARIATTRPTAPPPIPIPAPKPNREAAAAEADGTAQTATKDSGETKPKDTAE
jgi:small subunit ribosomal protein S16